LLKLKIKVKRVVIISRDNFSRNTCVFCFSFSNLQQNRGHTRRSSKTIDDSSIQKPHHSTAILLQLKQHCNSGWAWSNEWTFQIENDILVCYL